MARSSLQRNAKTIAIPVIGVKLKFFNKIKSKDPKVAAIQKMPVNRATVERVGQ
jgi:hypothetical protein